jgi:hypothetical protein
VGGKDKVAKYEVHPKSRNLEFLKASIADLITLLFSLLQNSEGGGNSGDSFADPCQFLPFPKMKI